MSVLLIRILWYQLKNRDKESIASNRYRDPVDITDCVDMNVKRGLDIKNNIVQLSLKNNFARYVYQEGTEDSGEII